MANFEQNESKINSLQTQYGEKHAHHKAKGQMDDFKNDKKNEGDRCVKDGQPAVCTPISKCQSALADIVKMKLPQLTLGNEAKFFIEVLGWTLEDKRGDPRSGSYLFGLLLLTNLVTDDEYSCKQPHFQACALQGSELTVCCVDDPAVGAGAARAPLTHTTEDAFPLYDYEYEHQQAPDGCEPIPSKLTSQRTGRKAWDSEYSLSRYPINHRDTYKKTVKKSDALDPKRLYKVARIVRHPDYHSPDKYNDIALLETNTEMLLDRLAMPACLPVGDSYNDSRAVALGFGASEFAGRVL
ncbi:hypothetical protein EVAR_97787_1 [Eumeta japonica]|uniref:Peptidase S1 domain-containing protein n=1 Tax=Eumeta variegata TaxID=151549 RepID=A0A4C1XDN5_EUMVA|nr:hypothetical protein EVAR_97787_1 [Eumeta japonica]